MKKIHALSRLMAFSLPSLSEYWTLSTAGSQDSIQVANGAGHDDSVCPFGIERLGPGGQRLDSFNDGKLASHPCS